MHDSEIVLRRITSDESRIIYRDEYYGGARQPVSRWNDDLRDPARRRRSFQSDRHPALDRLQTGAHRRRPTALILRNHNRHQSCFVSAAGKSGRPPTGVAKANRLDPPGDFPGSWMKSARLGCDRMSGPPDALCACQFDTASQFHGGCTRPRVVNCPPASLGLRNA